MKPVLRDNTFSSSHMLKYDSNSEAYGSEMCVCVCVCVCVPEYVFSSLPSQGQIKTLFPTRIL